MNAGMRGWRPDNGHRVPPGPRSLAEQTFHQPDVPAIRRFAAAFGTRAGFGAARRADFVLAVSEAAVSALAYGPCIPRLRLWTAGTHAFCEIYAHGMLFGPGPHRSWQDGAGALRRWLLRQLCDQLSVEPGPHGVTVRFSMVLT